MILHPVVLISVFDNQENVLFNVALADIFLYSTKYCLIEIRSSPERIQNIYRTLLTQCCVGRVGRSGQITLFVQNCLMNFLDSLRPGLYLYDALAITFKYLYNWSHTFDNFFIDSSETKEKKYETNLIRSRNNIEVMSGTVFVGSLYDASRDEILRGNFFWVTVVPSLEVDFRSK